MNSGLSHQDVIFKLRFGSPAQQSDIAQQLRRLAVCRLEGFCAKVGVLPTDLMESNESACAIAAYAQIFPGTGAGSSDQQAGLLLRWVVSFQEGSMPELAIMQIAGALNAVDLADVNHGASFRGGRLKGSVGPLRMAIRAAFEARGVMNNRELWAYLREQQPAGLQFSGKAGESLAEVFIDGGIGSKDWTYFVNRATEERKVL